MRAFLAAILWFATVYAQQALRIELLGIEPAAGPLSGNTRVLVRGTNFAGMEAKYPKPKCKFGRDDKVVDAAYVKCTSEPRKVWEMEPPTSAKTQT